jgi:hypothetical protein
MAMRNNNFKIVETLILAGAETTDALRDTLENDKNTLIEIIERCDKQIRSQRRSSFVVFSEFAGMLPDVDTFSVDILFDNLEDFK